LSGSQQVFSATPRRPTADFTMKTHPAVPADDDQLVRVHAQESFWRGFVPAVRDVIAHRELLANLVRKELKVKYKDSVLGFMWSLARPMFLLLIYYVVFGVFLGAGIPDFAIYLFSGLIAFDLFSTIVGGSTTAIVQNAGLIKKVYFPREILILSTVGAALVNFSLQVVVMLGALVIFRHPFVGSNLLLFPVGLVALIIFSTALGLLLAVANVRLRDVQHLIELVLMFWFWTAPIVYTARQATTSLGPRHLAKLYLVNPLVNIVMAFQRAFYRQGYVPGGAVDKGGVPVSVTGGSKVPVLTNNGALGLRLVAVILFSTALLWFAQRVFARAQGSFAQEL
jgi:ABC-2 type transport system permease protein